MSPVRLRVLLEAETSKHLVSDFGKHLPLHLVVPIHVYLLIAEVPLDFPLGKREFVIRLSGRRSGLLSLLLFSVLRAWWLGSSLLIVSNHDP